MSKASEFLSTFSKLEAVLSKHAQSLPEKYYHNRQKPRKVHDSLESFSHYTEACARDVRNRVSNESEFRVIIENLDKISLYNKLRNALAHNYDDPPIADPRQDAVEGIRKISSDITNPKTAQNNMIKTIKYDQPADNLYDALDDMAQNGFTNVPVIEEGRIVAVLSEKSALRWAAETRNDEVKLETFVSVWDIEKYLDDINDKTFDVYEFIPKALDVYSIEDIFIDYMREGKRVSTLFVTENGNHREGLLGIVTAWDLHKIDK